ncbi:NAD(P)-binding protein [Violaceomyces palustris]|uniref:NAD(P)-binding protein n=1 Tax=Violaceomyces palustris TaxID=1673888 RepID=A0ACD0NLW5_9BASI|nr:NAD(P)-binding protein [Violaceomyces palustris]
MRALRTLEDHKILVKVEKVTLNPTDWKHAFLISGAGNTLGCDFFGTVVQVRDPVEGVEVGDKVGGFVHGGKYEDRGSFAEYLVTDARLVYKVDPGFLEEGGEDSGHEAASFGVGGFTSVQALYHRLGLRLPSDLESLRTPPPLSENSPTLLVWSGSTSVGQFAIQLARLSGHRVITTSNPRNHDYLTSLGAHECFDYRDESVPETISSKYPNLDKALDCISEKGTQSLCVRSLGKGISKGQVIVLLKPEKEAIQLGQPQIEIVHILAYTALGRPFSYGRSAYYDQERVDKDSQDMMEWCRGDQGHFYRLIKSGLVKGNRIKLMSGGLEAIQEGLVYIRDGKVSAEKLGYTISS